MAASFLIISYTKKRTVNSIMRHRRCPKTLRKYGWCGVLALVYACGLRMPRTEKEFDMLLADLLVILGGQPKAKWQRSSNKKTHKWRGGITSSETTRVLEHYRPRCEHSVFRAKARGITMNFRAWLKTVQRNTTHIVHTGKHAVFVVVPSVRSRWQLYDQGGPKGKLDMHRMQRKGGLMLKKIHTVFTVVKTQRDFRV